VPRRPTRFPAALTRGVAALCCLAALSACRSAPGSPAATPSEHPSSTIEVTPSAATDEPTPAATLTPVGERCPGELTGGHATTGWITTSDGVRLYAASVGDGPVGLVMANDVPHSLCEELPEASLFAKHGFRVEVFDWRDRGDSGPSGTNPGRLDLDVVAAAHVLEHAGSKCVVLAGSYGGAAAAIVAATELQPVAVLGFDPAAKRGQYIEGPFGPEGALAAAPRVRAPAMLVTLEGDRFVPVAEARRLFRAMGSRAKSFVVVPSGIIGWSLLDVGPTRVQRAVFAFLERHASC